MPDPRAARAKEIALGFTTISETAKNPCDQRQLVGRLAQRGAELAELVRVLAERLSPPEQQNATNPASFPIVGIDPSGPNGTDGVYTEETRTSEHAAVAGVLRGALIGRSAWVTDSAGLLDLARWTVAELDAASDAYRRTARELGTARVEAAQARANADSVKDQLTRALADAGFTADDLDVPEVPITDVLDRVCQVIADAGNCHGLPAPTTGKPRTAAAEVAAARARGDAKLVNRLRATPVWDPSKTVSEMVSDLANRCAAADEALSNAAKSEHRVQAALADTEAELAELRARVLELNYQGPTFGEGDDGEERTIELLDRYTRDQEKHDRELSSIVQDVLRAVHPETAGQLWQRDYPKVQGLAATVKATIEENDELAAVLRKVVDVVHQSPWSGKVNPKSPAAVGLPDRVKNIMETNDRLQECFDGQEALIADLRGRISKATGALLEPPF